MPWELRRKKRRVVFLGDLKGFMERLATEGFRIWSCFGAGTQLWRDVLSERQNMLRIKCWKQETQLGQRVRNRMKNSVGEQLSLVIGSVTVRRFRDFQHGCEMLRAGHRAQSCDCEYFTKGGITFENFTSQKNGIYWRKYSIGLRLWSQEPLRHEPVGNLDGNWDKFPEAECRPTGEWENPVGLCLDGGWLYPVFYSHAQSILQKKDVVSRGSDFIEALRWGFTLNNGVPLLRGRTALPPEKQLWRSQPRDTDTLEHSDLIIRE